MASEKERDKRDIVTIHPEIRGELFRLMSYSLNVLSFAQSQG